MNTRLQLMKAADEWCNKLKLLSGCRRKNCWLLEALWVLLKICSKVFHSITKHTFFVSRTQAHIYTMWLLSSTFRSSFLFSFVLLLSELYPGDLSTTQLFEHSGTRYQSNLGQLRKSKTLQIHWHTQTETKNGMNIKNCKVDFSL